MADTAVSCVLQHLFPLVRDEANLLWGISKAYADIKKEQESIQDLLKEEEERAEAEGDNAHEKVKAWVKQLREATFLIEDVDDEYQIYEEQRLDDLGCAALLCKSDITHFIETFKHGHRIASEIQQIKSGLQGIMQRKETYDSQSQPPKRIEWHDPRIKAFSLEAKVVGIEGPRDDLIGRLVQGPTERFVISVVGIGGVGKTTLVNRVFNNQKVIDHFDCLAWVTVSQSCTAERLMDDLLKKLCPGKGKTPPQNSSQMEKQLSLIREVRTYLEKKRYVVIFDDVWNNDFWDLIEDAMIDNNNGSRVLITTRNITVANSCMKSHSCYKHELECLTSEKSMELFCKVAFKSGSCPDLLKEISSKIVKKCGGLPLAIVAIGGLFSGRLTVDEWKILYSGLETNQISDVIRKILGFSYDDLPSHLKPCLLYFGMYPEDYDVKSTRLVRQWIAEGFVEKEEENTLEDVAQKYLAELIGRNLVQVSSFTIDGKVRSCRVLDPVHEMIRRKLKYSSFGEHIREDEVMSSGIIRRLSIATISNKLIGSAESSNTRALLVFGGKSPALTNKFFQKILTKYRRLKVLDFEDDQLLSVPDNLGNLTHLKYLSLRHARKIKSLPEFIGKLQNLETLDIRDTDVREMPKDICKLSKLRHLLGNKMKLFQLENGLGGMSSLQTLCQVMLSIDDDGAALIGELGKLTQLRTLGLAGVKKEQGSPLCSSIKEMQKLEKLYIESTSHDEVIDLSDISPLHKLLRKHSLVGKLNNFPEWVPQLQNLVKLSLKFCMLTDDPLKSLQDMPHLLFLGIGVKSYEGKSLYFQDGGFKQLKELHLEYLFNLNSIIIGEGSLQSVKRIKFLGIPQLKTAPDMQHLKKLEVLLVSQMSTEFNQCIDRGGVPEHVVIQHV